jgi:ubiquinol-cytochrome c reductase cytochrome c1 subunit
MRELISLVIIIVFTSVTYYFIGPFAHAIEGEKNIPSANFVYSDLPTSNLQGDAIKGKALVAGAGACVSCHSIKVAGIASSMSPEAAAKAFGIAPPDLSNAGVLYNTNFLTAYIENPVHAMNLQSKYNAKTGKVFPMPKFVGAGGNKKQEIADMVAYFKSIAIKKDKLTPQIAFENSCGRCHAVRYEKWTQIGLLPKFKNNREKFAFESSLANYQYSLSKYLGSLPPDLSTIVESKTKHFVSTFIENPQNYIKGTAMPRVGISNYTAKKVITYLEKSADPKQAERESFGKKLMIYLLIFAIFAYLWKRTIWKDLH